MAQRLSNTEIALFSLFSSYRLVPFYCILLTFVLTAMLARH